MSATTDELLDTALKLSSGDRARLAAELIASLDGPPDEGVEEAWAVEIEHRAAQVADGSVKLVDWDTVKSRIKPKTRKR